MAVKWRGSRLSSNSGLSIDDLNLVETHDCFTIAELIEYEAMGLVPEGEGARAIKEGMVTKGWQTASKPIRRPESKRPSNRRNRRVHACADGHAADRQCW